MNTYTEALNRAKQLYDSGSYNIDLLFSKNYNNPVDACVAMVEKLHERKML